MKASLSLSCAAVWAPLLGMILLACVLTEPWAKVELTHHGCNATHYVTMQFGVCDTLIRSWDEHPNRHCIEWKDRSDWKEMDEQASGDTHFAADAKHIMPASWWLLLASLISGLCYAFVIGNVGKCCPSEDTSDYTIFAFPFLIAVFPCALGSLILAVSSSQLSEEAWEDATGCDAKITWMTLLPVVVVVVALSCCTFAYFACGRVPDVIVRMPEMERLREDRFGGRILFRPAYAAQALRVAIADEDDRVGSYRSSQPPTPEPAPAPAPQPTHTSSGSDFELSYVVPPPSHRAFR